MKIQLTPENGNNYEAPRNNPLIYPGLRPKNSFILSDGVVYPILFDDKEKGRNSTYAGNVVIDNHGNFKKINAFLNSKNKATLEERFVLLGFGSNPVPGQLISKFGDKSVVPVIYGTLDDCEVVYNLISSQGYAFAELYLNQIDTKGNIAITFLDEEQLKIMNETEENYDLAFIPKEINLDSGEIINPNNELGLFYAGKKKIWVPNGYKNPIAIEELNSIKRKASALSQEKVLDLVVQQFNLNDRNIFSGSDLVKYIRKNTSQNNFDLINYIQNCINNDPNSLESVSSSVQKLKDPLNPPKVFGNYHKI